MKLLTLVTLLCVLAFALPVMARDLSPPGQAIEKHQAVSVDAPATVLAPTCKYELTPTPASVKAHGALNSTATQHERLSLRSRHELLKTPTRSNEGAEARYVLRC